MCNKKCMTFITHLSYATLHHPVDHQSPSRSRLKTKQYMHFQILFAINFTHEIVVLT